MEGIDSTQRNASILTFKRWWVAYFIMLIGIIGAIIIFADLLFYYYENYDQSYIVANRQAIFTNLFGSPSIILAFCAFIGGVIAKEQFKRAAIAILFTIFIVIFGFFLMALFMSNTESPEFFQGDISILLIFAIMMLIMSAILSLIIGSILAIPGFIGSFFIKKLTGAGEEPKLQHEMQISPRSRTLGGFQETSIQLEDQRELSKPLSDEDSDWD